MLYKLTILFFFFASSALAQSEDSLLYSSKKLNRQLKIINRQFLINNKQLPDTKHGTRNNKQEIYVILFLDTECPICQKYTLKINEIDSVCRANQIFFVGVFTDKSIKKEAIEHFKNKYNLNINTWIDKKLELAKALQASTTPEVFLIDMVGERLAYRGLIDDWFYRLGKNKPVPTVHYLLSAIDFFLKKQEISIRKTTPVGCLIQY